MVARVPAPEWLDAQYNNRARVFDSAAILERWSQASVMVRDRARCRLDIAYGEGPDEKLDVFPTDASQAPVLVFIHGGWWRALDKADHSFLAASFAEEGAMVVVPNYSLCPRVAMERIPLQLTQAIAWAWRHAAEHGGDPNRIVLVGHSAGGHLATMLSCCDWKAVGVDLPRQLVKGVVTISGVHELDLIPHVPFLKDDLRLDAEAARRLSPVNFPAPDSPTYAIVGGAESEEFVRQTKALRKAWGKTAVPVCEEIAGFNHFDILHDLADPQGRSHLLVKRMLDLRWYSPLL